MGFALQHTSAWEPQLAAWNPGEITARLADTVEGWRSWSAIHQSYEGPWRDLVHHSGRVLRALTFAPTGAIVAAPTTSLPETIGGERNWDYRYTWVRDACFTMEALWVAACPAEAGRFFTFLADAAASQLERGMDLQIMFGIGGEHDLSERELPHLSGWRGSRPVRVGNGAWNQRQLDVYGELLGAAWRLVEQLGELDPVTRGFMSAAADTAAARWRGEGPGHLGDPGRPAALPVLQAHVLGGAGPGHRAGPAARRGGQGGGLGGRPRRDPGRHPGARMEREGGRVHPGVRQRRPGRLQSDAGDQRVPAR